MVKSSDSEAVLASAQGFLDLHRSTYLESGGTRGHIIQFSQAGARGYMPTLLLRTIGRKSGRPLIVPLIYGCHSGEWVVIGSKGGAPEHPAWYHNLIEQPDVAFQIGTQAFRGSWRLARGAERTRLWSYMVEHCPPFDAYKQASQGRDIPVVMLSAAEEIPVFEAA